MEPKRLITMNFDEKDSEPSRDVIQEQLNNSINECQVKLSLIDDYLERFQIEDARLVAPIKDIERCVAMMHHTMGCDGNC